MGRAILGAGGRSTQCEQWVDVGTAPRGVLCRRFGAPAYRWSRDVRDDEERSMTMPQVQSTTGSADLRIRACCRVGAGRACGPAWRWPTGTWWRRPAVSWWPSEPVSSTSSCSGRPVVQLADLRRPGTQARPARTIPAVQRWQRSGVSGVLGRVSSELRELALKRGRRRSSMAFYRAFRRFPASSSRSLSAGFGRRTSRCWSYRVRPFSPRSTVLISTAS